MLPLPGRLTHLHQAPGVRLCRHLFGDESLPRPLPLAGPSSAPGLVSNAFRRNAAHMLWSACYPCSIFHTLASRFLAVPPPLSAPSRPARVATFGSTPAGFQTMSRLPFSSRLWAILWSVRNPEFFRHDSHRDPALSLRYSTAILLSSLPLQPFIGAFSRSLSSSLNPHGSDAGHGPCRLT
jgi:hypothetical protein